MESATPHPTLRSLRSRRATLPTSGRDEAPDAVAVCAMTSQTVHIPTPPRSRRVLHASFANREAHLKFRGRRECRALDAPAASCAKIENTRDSHHGHTGFTRHSPRNGFTAYSALFPVIGLSCHRHQRSCLRQLDAGVEASEPHDFVVRVRAVRQQHISVHRIPPRVRDDREPPLLGTRRRRL